MPDFKWADIPDAAQQWMLRHLEHSIERELHRIITYRPVVRQGSYSSAVIHGWTAADHVAFFGTTKDVTWDNDDEMAAKLFPLSRELPWKRIGHRLGDQYMQVCGKGVARRTEKSTIIYFTYSRFDFDANSNTYENRYAPIEDTVVPGKRRKRVKAQP